MPGKLSKDASATVKITVKVTPANDPRVVKLQQYDSVNKEWITRATYHVENQDKAAITVTLAKKYRKKTTGKWRVFVPATEQAQEAVSKVCTVTSRNVVTKSLSARSACIYCIDNGNVIYTKKYKTRRSPIPTVERFEPLHRYTAWKDPEFLRRQDGDRLRREILFYRYLQAQEENIRYRCSRCGKSRRALERHEEAAQLHSQLCSNQILRKAKEAL